MLCLHTCPEELQLLVPSCSSWARITHSALVPIPNGFSTSQSAASTTGRLCQAPACTQTKGSPSWPPPPQDPGCTITHPYLELPSNLLFLFAAASGGNDTWTLLPPHQSQSPSPSALGISGSFSSTSQRGSPAPNPSLQPAGSGTRR